MMLFISLVLAAMQMKDAYGEGVLSSVLSVAGGLGVGLLTNTALDALDKHTGIVSDVGSVVDDVIDTFKFW